MYRFLKLAGLAGCAAAVGLGTYLFAIQATGNFAEVVPGTLYRSNQPTALHVADYAERYGIKTIVNLRGSSEDATWYKSEVAAARSLNIKHYRLQDGCLQAIERGRSPQACRPVA